MKKHEKAKIAAAKKPYTKLFEFPVLHKGWEMDSRGWVAELDSGKRVLVLENHGTEYIAKESELQERIAEYEAVLQASHEALTMLNQIQKDKQ